jgi:CRISPR/Cas system CSM-associated protein Csm3 (group 7 of RAMP superfamily)
MHKCLWNLVKLEIELEPLSPLLIKSGTSSPNPALPDMQFVRTLTPQGERVFIPGSSLKGGFRGFTEKVLRTIGYACDPFADDACGRRLTNEEDTARVYRESCPACKIYGNTRLRGRLAFTDLFPAGKVKTETRYGVAISRLTNAVAVGPFDMEVLVSGTFRGALVLENFEIWQLGLLALTARAVNEGMVKVGFGKNRGLGQVRLGVRRVIAEMAKRKEIGPDQLWGAGAFASEDDRDRYGLRSDDGLDGLPAVDGKDLGILLRREYTGEQWEAISEKAIEKLGILERSP